MSAPAWSDLEALFYEALARLPAERAAFLAERCAGRRKLQAQVEAMLKAHEQGQAAGLPASGEYTQLSAGTRLGPYAIVGPLGAGGMGEVYRARDSRLRRDVAIKILPPAFMADADRAARFEREAHVLAALNHPHIAAIYGFEQDALILELVEGETLADRIARGPIPIRETLGIARQIAEALEAAHEKAIVHRDLKPANIKITPEGTVKLLDFGLAKAMSLERVSPDGGAGPIAAVADTREGLIMGTAAYMSPEQARGQTVDKRTDIWAFGCVLYEMLTGRAPFAGDTVSDTLAAILNREPDWAALPAATPAAVCTLIRRCLEKEGRQRIADISVARFVLDDPDTRSQAPPAAEPPARLRLWQGLAALAAVTALGLVGWTVRSDPTPGQASRFVAPLPENATFYGYVSVSPDGRKLAVTEGQAGRRGLWIRDFSTLEWRRLPGTELAGSPFWSPDSRYLAFAAGNQLRKIDIAGGPPQTLASMPVRIEGSGAWNRNGAIIAGSWGGGAGGPLWKIPDTGGAATAITEVDASKGELYHTWPTFTEDGEHFVYFRSGTPDVEGIYAGSLDAAPAEQSRTRILATEFPASYANGYLFFVRANTLLAQRLDLRNLTLTGEAVPVTEALETTWFRTGVFSVSSGGALAYRTDQTGGSSGKLQLTWLDAQGRTLSTVGQPDRNAQVSLSPDGSRAAVRDALLGQTGDLWMVDLANGGRTRLTFRRSDWSPAVWSPDGGRIAYAGGNLGDTLYEKPSSGVGDEKVLLKAPGTRHYPTSWSSDGRFLLYHTENTPGTGYDLWVLPLQGEHKPVRLLNDVFNEWAGFFSPDARWIAYVSNEADGAHVYVRPFVAVGPSGVPALGEGRWQVSTDAGNWPKWIGEHIIFNDVPGGTSLFTVRVNTSGRVFQSGVPQRLFRIPSGDGLLFQVSPDADAQRFLWAGPQDQRTAQAPITVVLNWQEELTQREQSDASKTP